MSTVKWIGYIIASLLVLSAVLSGFVFIAVLATIGGTCFALVALVSFVAYGIKDYFEKK